MNANPSVRVARIPTGVAPILMAALLAAAFLLGGTGGYLIRDVSISWPAGATNTVTTRDSTTRPFVIESPPPYASPATLPATHGADSDLTRAQPAQQSSKRVTD